MRRDLYNIPGDTGWPWRLNKFVEYQHVVPAIHPVFLKGYIERHSDLTLDDFVWISWLISCTYNEITTVFIFESMKDEFGELHNVTKSWCDNFWEKHRDNLVFNSARRYVKANDKFTELIMNFKEVTNCAPFEWVDSLSVHDNPLDNYTDILSAIKEIPYVGRFSGDLFMESLLHITTYKNVFNIEEDNNFEWEKCANLTSGLFNILYMDAYAEHYDKQKTVSEFDKKVLNKGLLEVQKKVQEVYPEQDSRITMIITKICSFRNLFKKTRYAGFHHDRELETIIKYEKAYPDLHLWQECYNIRKMMFSENLLGEVGGWSGIRKDHKSLFISKGLTGAELI